MKTSNYSISQNKERIQKFQIFLQYSFIKILKPLGLRQLDIALSGNEDLDEPGSGYIKLFSCSVENVLKF